MELATWSQPSVSHTEDRSTSNLSYQASLARNEGPSINVPASYCVEVPCGHRSAQHLVPRPGVNPRTDQPHDEPRPESLGSDPAYGSTDAPLGRLDVFALIFNKIVGTGIFATPGLVLLLIGNPTISVCLWVAGGVHTALCLWIYLKLGTKFPYNGGELIYLDRLYRCGFLAAISFAGYTLTFGHTTGNAIAFGRYTYSCVIGPEADLDPGWTKFIAICALFMACFVLHAMPAAGMFLNKILAIFKVALLLLTIIEAAQLPTQPDSPFLTAEQSSAPKFSNIMGAFVYVIYTYTGWENANYVAGEIREMHRSRRNNRLVQGSFGALILTILLYVLLVYFYYRSGSYASITKAWTRLGMGTDFGPRAFSDEGQPFSVLVAVCAFGNLIAVVYTGAKIKQAIARERFIPFWQFIEKGGTHSSHVPAGGLTVHGLMTAIWILALPIDRDAYSFVIGIATYGRIILETCVFLAIVIILSRTQAHPILHRPTNLPIAGILTGFNIMLLYFGAIEAELDVVPALKGIVVPRHWWPVVVGGVFLVSLLYWVVLQVLQLKWPDRKAQDGAHRRTNGVSTSREDEQDHRGHSRTVGEKIGISIKVYKQDTASSGNQWPREIRSAMQEAEDDGTQRRMVTTITRRPPSWLRNGASKVWHAFRDYLC